MKKLMYTWVGLLALAFAASAQQPYKINPATGDYLKDANGNPIVNDPNFKPVKRFYDDFSSAALTKSKFKYGMNIGTKLAAFYVQEDPNEDNCAILKKTCTCQNYHYFGNTLRYPIGHIYNAGGTITLRTQHYTTPVPGWFKTDTFTIDTTCNWQKVSDNFEYTTGSLISQESFKYGYFEARFKINRPINEVSNQGIGQCFWLYGSSHTNNTGPNQYCYSEIDIAENFPFKGVQTSGAIVSSLANDDNCPATKKYNLDSRKHQICEEDTWNGACITDIYPLITQDQYHIYALEWTPGALKYYFDNKLFMTINNIGHEGKTPRNFDPLSIFFDIEGASKTKSYYGRCSKFMEPGITVFPFDFEIDYVNLYKLDTSQCMLHLPLIDTQSSFMAFAGSPKARKTITINGGSTCAIAVSGGQEVYLRAADYILIEDGFCVDEHSVLFLDALGGCDNGY